MHSGGLGIYIVEGVYIEDILHHDFLSSIS